MRRSASLVIAIVATGLTFPVAAGQASQPETVSVWHVDYSGRPPFKRARVELPAADVARMEVTDTAGKTVRVWTTDFSGRPPFRRGYADLPVIDTARMEETADDSAAHVATRARPFFKKRHR